MSDITFSILLALSVGFLVWGVARVINDYLRYDRRKLQERLHRRTGAPEAAQPNTLRMQADSRTPTSCLMRWRFGRYLHRLLLQAYPEVPVSRFLAIATGIAVSTLLLVTLLIDSALAGLVAGAMGGYIPVLALQRKRNRRQRLMADQLPAALDFLARTMRAGHSLTTGLQILAEEIPQPLAGEFRRGYDQHTLGQAIEESLRDMATRVQCRDFALFVTAVLIQKQAGGDLAEVLDNISQTIRQRVRLQQQVRARTAEGRFTGYLLLGFPVGMFGLSYALNAKQTGILLHTTEGLTLLGIAAGLQILGWITIRKITTVKV